MKILFCYNLGAGNCIEMIPLYLSLEKEYGRVIDCCYIMQNQGDNPKNADCTPNPICPGVMMNDIVDTLPEYDYVIKPPWIYDSEGNYFKEHVDNMRETDSEVSRNGRIAEFLGIPYILERKWRTSELSVPERYVVMHNGAQDGWEDKKYPKMEELAWRIQREGIKCVSVGAPHEYIFGTENFTGLKWTQTAHVIENSIAYLGTDTGTYHLAGLMEKPGVAIFTKTSIGKNWDSDFHHTIKPIQRDLDCICQRQYHWKLGVDCNRECRDIPLDTIFNALREKIDGLQAD